MSAIAPRPATATTSAAITALLPLMAAVFVAYLVIGLAMPVLPLHVHQGLGFGTFVVGLVSGTQFSASLFSRVWAGQHADNRGAKHTVLTGLSVAVAAGLFYLISLRFVAKPEASVGILLVGRALLGGAESFIITGALSWGLALLGAQNTGKVMAWLGTALWGAKDWTEQVYKPDILRQAGPDLPGSADSPRSKSSSTTRKQGKDHGYQTQRLAAVRKGPAE